MGGDRLAVGRAAQLVTLVRDDDQVDLAALVEQYLGLAQVEQQARLIALGGDGAHRVDLGLAADVQLQRIAGCGLQCFGGSLVDVDLIPPQVPPASAAGRRHR